MRGSRNQVVVSEMTGISDSWKHFIKVYNDADLFVIVLSLGTPELYTFEYARVFDRFTDIFIKEAYCPSNDIDEFGQCLVDESSIPGVNHCMCLPVELLLTS